MKKLVFICLLSWLLLPGKLFAQAPFVTLDSITANNIHLPIRVHGDMLRNPYNTSYVNSFFAPRRSSRLAGSGAVWMSGYDGAGQLHVAAQTYRQDGNDYWPGPISGGVAISYDASEKWAKIWKVNRADIDAFRAQSTHTFINTDISILTWPGKNNAFARGNNNEPLVVNNDMAPFVDLNGNGTYEPLAGEYPAIKGEQALWNVFNDNGPAHTQSNGRPLSVEIRSMTYAYNRGTLIDNVVYTEYTVTNRSTNNYTDFRLAIWDNMDLGYYLDDYIGFDSAHRMGIYYNATNDDGQSGGHPTNSNDTPPSMLGLTMIELPGDIGASYMPAGSFIYYNNDISIIGAPVVDTEYDNYLRSKFRGGAHLHNDYHGAGIPGSGLGTGPLTDYVFTGDLSGSGGWSECAMANNPGDRYTVLASNSFNLNAGETKKIVWALLVADTAGGCGHANFDRIKTLADTAWYIHQNPPTALVNVVQGRISVYPNPAHDRLYIKDADGYSDITEVAVINKLGQKVKAPYDEKEKAVDVAALPPGIYNLMLITDGYTRTTTFLKH